MMLSGMQGEIARNPKGMAQRRYQGLKTASGRKRCSRQREALETENGMTE
ncbi:hypothetical protein [Bordetella genomosp. 12]|nr:hypothetical protein [Bordetella genomosp. 12]